MKPTQEKTPEQITKEQTPTQTPEKTPEQEEKARVSTLQGEILDSCYKAQEIGKALEYLLTCPPEYANFDPCIMAQSILDYLGQIEQKANSLTKGRG